MLPVANSLRDRGHSVIFFQLPDVGPSVSAEGHKFVPIGMKRFPKGTRRAWDEKYSRASGLRALKMHIERSLLQADAFFSDGPREIHSSGVDALVIDQVALYGGLIADYLGMPYVALSVALPLNRDYDHPPFFTSWRYHSGRLWNGRNWMAYQVLDCLARPLVRRCEQQKRKWDLAPNTGTRRPRLAVTQLPLCLDYPRTTQDTLLHTGPYTVWRKQPEVTFPWDRLDGRPLVYASLGTLQNGRHGLFRLIARACHRVAVQLVISLGGGTLQPDALEGLPGCPVVVSFAPQLDLIRKAAVVISHGGVNTVLESLWEGVPVLALPIANDQPGMASRLEHSGAGLAISPRFLTVPRLVNTLDTLLSSAKYRDAALMMRTAMRQCNGPAETATLIETTLERQHSEQVLATRAANRPLFDGLSSK